MVQEAQMKKFKQLINEIAEGPKAGKEWDSYTHAMFGSESIKRPTEFKEKPEHIKWLRRTLGNLSWQYGVPHENGHRLQDLRITDVKENQGDVSRGLPPKIEIHTDASKYEDDLKRFRLSHDQSMNIPSFVDEIEDADLGDSHKELQARLSYQLRSPVRIHKIEYHPSSAGQTSKLVVHLNSDDVRRAHQNEKNKRDEDDGRWEHRSGPEDWNL
jgi:sulfite reductase beta subunit-like hemoprotein